MVRARILTVLEAGDRWPSGVVRGLAYRELFAAHGLDVVFVSRTPFESLDWIRKPRRVVGRILNHRSVKPRLERRAWEQRHRRILEMASGQDVVYLNKVLDLPFVRELRQASDARIVLDFGDAMWLYQSNLDDFHEVLRIVDAVTTDNEKTAAYIQQYNRDVVVIPDAPQLELFNERRSQLSRTEPNRSIIIGWIGSANTAYNLFVVWEALEELFERHSNLHLRLVGTGHDPSVIPPFERVRFSVRPGYTQAEMIEEVFGMDIGLFPLQDVEKCRVRGVLKATVYMSGEAAVVASPVGQVPELITDGVNGMLADSKTEWVEKIERLAMDSHLRQNVVNEGLKTVHEGFTLEKSFMKLKSVLLGENAVEN